LNKLFKKIINKLLYPYSRFINNLKKVINNFDYLGKDVSFGKHLKLDYSQNIVVNDSVTLSDYTWLAAGKKPKSLVIGNNTYIHRFCILRSGLYHF